MPLLVSMMKALSLKGCEIHFAEEIKDFTNAMKEVAQAILMTNPRIRTDEEIFEATKKKGSEKVNFSWMRAVNWLVAHPNSIGTFFACSHSLRMQC